MCCFLCHVGPSLSLSKLACPNGEAMTHEHGQDVGVDVNLDEFLGPEEEPGPRRALRKTETIDPQQYAVLTQPADRRVISHQSLGLGSFLFEMASDNANRLRLLAPDRPLAGDGHFKWASACSGSEGARFVLDAMNMAFEEFETECHLSHAFSCEKALEKRKWIREVMQCQPCPLSEEGDERRKLDITSGIECKSGGPLAAGPSAGEANAYSGLPCIFEDISDLGAEHAKCWQHGEGTCKVPSVDLLIIGTSCKDRFHFTMNIF